MGKTLHTNTKDLTDHFAVFLNISSTKCVQLQDYDVIRNYSLDNIELFLSLVSRTEWDNVFDDQDVETSFNLCFGTFSYLY